MATLIQNRKTTPSLLMRYGVTEAKKAELDQLSDQVVETEFTVEKYQAAVDALSEKLSKFQTYFATADANRISSLNNLNTIKNIVQNTKELKVSSNTALKEVSVANREMRELAIQVRTVVEELIYTTESINKLSNLITRKKAKNPLISDELISILATAGTDANSAVALMLTAMKGTFTAQASVMESSAAAALEFSQSVTLYEIITGTDYSGEQSEEYQESLVALINKAHDMAEGEYEKHKNAVKITTDQLNEAQSNLSKAEVELSSLKAGLAAANAAALAS